MTDACGGLTACFQSCAGLCLRSKGVQVIQGERAGSKGPWSGVAHELGVHGPGVKSYGVSWCMV